MVFGNYRYTDSKIGVGENETVSVYGTKTQPARNFVTVARRLRLDTFIHHPCFSMSRPQETCGASGCRPASVAGREWNASR